MTTLSEAPARASRFLTQSDRTEPLTQHTDVPMVSDADVGDVNPQVRIEAREDGRTITVSIVGISGHPDPDLRQLIYEATSLLSLPAGWDSYNASRIRPSAVARSLEFLISIGTDRIARPSVVPTSEGGIQLEWHRQGVDVEIEFPPFEKARVFVHRQDGTEWENEGAKALDRAAEAIPSREPILESRP